MLPSRTLHYDSAQYSEDGNHHREERLVDSVDVSNFFERTPLLQQNLTVSCLHKPVDDSAYSELESKENIPSCQMYREELGILSRYALPVLVYVSISTRYLTHTFLCSTQIFEYSFSFVSVIVIGHLSTVYLAAATLGMMTASVTGYSIVQGAATALDTLLPPAWTSDTPHMVGLWTQRMGTRVYSSTSLVVGTHYRIKWQSS